MDAAVTNISEDTLFYKESLEIINKYPKLRIENFEKSKILIGEIDLIDESGIIQDSYHIEIHPTQHYPFQFPYLYEKGGRIPINIDWHVYPDGHCCIKTIVEEIIVCKNGIALDYFIELEVKPYLFNQTHRRLKGYFLNERSHGILGEIEFYQEVFKTKSLLKIIEWGIFILNNDEPNRVSDCFCGSTSKYRKCHREAFRKLKDLGNAALSESLKNIIFSRYFYKSNPTSAVQYRRFFDLNDTCQTFVN